MSDKNYSLEDILKEHPHKQEPKKTQDDIIAAKPINSDSAFVQKTFSYNNPSRYHDTLTTLMSRKEKSKSEKELIDFYSKKSPQNNSSTSYQKNILNSEIDKKQNTMEIKISENNNEPDAFEILNTLDFTKSEKKRLNGKKSKYSDKKNVTNNQNTANVEEFSFQYENISAINTSAKKNDSVMEQLIHMKKERIINTASIPVVERKSVKDITYDLKDLIIPNTEKIVIDQKTLELQKLKELKDRRRQVIKDFVLHNDDDNELDKYDAYKASPDKEISEFTKYDEAPAIQKDINQLKNSLIARLFILIFLGIFSAYLTLASDFQLPLPEFLSKTNPTVFIFANIVISLLAIFFSYTVVSCGLGKLIKFKPDCDSICSVGVSTSVIAAMLSLCKPELVASGLVNIYTSVAIFALLFNTIGKLLIVSRTNKNFKLISGDFDRYAVFNIDDKDKAELFTKGILTDFPCLASMKETEFINDFLKYSYSTDISDKFSEIASPVILIFACALSVIGGIISRGSGSLIAIMISIGIFSLSCSICSCFGLIISVHFPLYRATKKYLNYSAAMLSYQSIDDFSDTNSILLDATHLFPQGMVNLSAIKIFSDTRIDEAIVAAASLTNHAGSILKTMFYDIIGGKTDILDPVESYIYEDSMGLCGWINNKRILLGNRALMLNHSINGLPTISKEKKYTTDKKIAVYLSISGELSAMFVVEINANLEVKNWLSQLEKNNVCVILRSVDSLISINRLSELFDVSPDMLKIMPFRLHKDYEQLTSYKPKQTASLTCIGKFPSFASLIIGTKRIKKAAKMGITIQATSAVLGILIVFIFLLINKIGMLSPSVILIYNLAWVLITLIIESFRKT